MKLAMRAQSAYKKVTLMATAFVLAVSSLTAAVPFILSEKASALSSSIHTSNLADWPISDTRTAGTNTLTNTGLYVKTTPSAGGNAQSKAALYRAAQPGLLLSDVDSTSITFNSYEGVRPSVQLGVDRDGNGTWDGYLVYEPWAYGDGQYWVNKPDFGVPAGGGYTSMGTLAQYQTANPNARVLTVGYSLGSGVVGEAEISSIVIGETTYTFGLPVNQAPVVNFIGATPANGSTVSGTATAQATITDDNGIAASYVRFWKGAYEVANGGQLLMNCQAVPGGSGLGTSTSPICSFDTTTVADGTKMFISAQTEDSNGVTAAAPVRQFTVDNTAPTITIKPGYVGNIATNIFSNVSFKLSDTYKVDKIVINGNTKNLTDSTFSDANFNDIKQYFTQGVNTVIVYDVAGNTTTKTFTYDSQTPTVQVNLGRLMYIQSGASVRSTMMPEIEAFDKELTKIAITKKSDGSAVTEWTNVTKNVVTRKGINWLAQGTYLIRAYDEAGLVSAPFEVTIDNTAPTATFTYSNSNGNAVTNQDVVVTMTATEPLTTPEGWTAVEGQSNVFTKSYSANGKYTVVISDTAGNTSAPQKFEVKRIDKTDPVVTGIEEGKTYRGDVTFNVNDQNFSKLFVNGNEVSTTHPGGWDYALATALSVDGEYVIMATDKGGNKTTVNIVIDNSVEITMDVIDLTVDNPTVSGRAAFVADDAPLANTELLILVDGDQQYPVTTDENGEFSTPIGVANGEHTITVSRVNEDYQPTEQIYQNTFVTTIPPTTPTDPVDPEEPTGPTGPATPANPADPVDEGDEEDNSGTLIPGQLTFPAAINPGAFAQVLGDSTVNNEADNDNQGTPEVEGVSTQNNVAQAVDSDANQGRFMGMAWYWWLLILAAIVGLIWWIAAAVRRRNAEQN